MNKIIFRHAASIVLIVLIALGSTVSVSGSNLPSPQIAQSIEVNSLVMLRADPAVKRSFVPPPAEFARLRAQSATITVNYLAGGTTDVYDYSCNTWPSEARQAFDYAVSIWASQINSSVPIVIDACWTTLGQGILGYGGAPYRRNFTNAPQSNTWYPVALANALAGHDLNGSNAEINVGYSSAFSWYYDTDGNTPSDRYDFASVVLHEICHGLGFSGSMEVSGGMGSWGSDTGAPDIYDRFTENGSGQSLIDTGLFPNPSSALAAQLTSGDVYFDGPNANAANGGARPKLYAPGTWSQGSSYSHLDEIFNGTANALMTYSLGRAEANHAPGPIALGVLKDVGWTIGSTPLPAPTLASITPQQGVNNSTVDFSLSGGNFQSGASVQLTMAGQTDIQATDLAIGASLITGRFDLNGVAAGQWSVVVTNPDGQSAVLENGFTVTAPPPVLTSITPDHGANNDTAFDFTLAGSAFQVLASVKLSRSGQADIPAINLNVSASQITGRFNLDGKAPGLWNVVVTNLDGQSAVLENGFRIVYPPPALTSITPNSGSNAGVVSITDLAGSYFQAGASVKLSQAGQADIQADNVSVASSTRIECELDLSGAATGDWDVVVTNPDLQSATLENGFTVNFLGKTWTGAESGDWHTGGNWEPAGVPTATDDVRIPDVARDPVISGTAAAVNNLIVDAGASLDLSRSQLSVEGAMINNGTLAQSRHVSGQVSATAFLRITDLAGGQVKYRGLDITITGPGTLYLPGVVVTASVSGNQFCAGRTTGVKRCFDITPAQAMSATVRFYFTEAERNDYSLDELIVVHEDAVWTEEPGPYTRGGEGSAQYVEARNVDDFSHFSLDRSASGIFYTYMPMVTKNWPPVPYAPSLVVASNDGYGNYSLSWDMPSMPAAIPPVTSYKLQEANNGQFTAASDTLLSVSSHTVASKPAGTYWYRVAARNSYGYGSWSSPQQVVVQQLPGTFYAIEDACILEGRPDANLGGTSDMWVGYDDYLDPDGMIVRSLIKFDLSVIPGGAVLNNAVLRVYKSASYDFEGEWRIITAYRISSPWFESSVSWNTRPDYSTAYGSSSVPHDTYGWHSFDVTGLVQGWINGSVANFGIMLRGPEWSGEDSSWKAFYTRERGDPYTPQLVLIYANYAAALGNAGLDGVQAEGAEASAEQSARTIKVLAGER